MSDSQLSTNRTLTSTSAKNVLRNASLAAAIQKRNATINKLDKNVQILLNALDIDLKSLPALMSMTMS